MNAPPNAPGAEVGVLSAVMHDTNCLDTVAAIITPADFYTPRNRVLFQAMLDMSREGTPVDVITLPEWLQARDLLQLVGGYDVVQEMMRDAFSAASAVAHAEIVRDRATRRSAIEAARHLAMRAYDVSQETAAVVDDGVRALMELHRTERKYEFTMTDAARMAVQHLQQVVQNGGKLTGITTGLTDLDEVLGGLQRSDLMIVAARPAMGKTALMLCWAIAAAKAGHPVGIISSEQPTIQLAMRMLSMQSGVESSRLRVGRIDDGEWSRITDGSITMRSLPIWIYDRAAPNSSEVIRILRKWRHQHGIEGGYVDYLQRVQGDSEKENKADRIGEIARDFKNCARDLEIALVALAQVKREVEQRSNKRPRMGDISDTSDIEKEADQIATVYRDEVYNTDSPAKGTAEIILDKNRHGPIGITTCAFHAPTMTFRDLVGSDQYLGSYS